MRMPWGGWVTGNKHRTRSGISYMISLYDADQNLEPTKLIQLANDPGKGKMLLPISAPDLIPKEEEHCTDILRINTYNSYCSSSA